MKSPIKLIKDVQAKTFNIIMSTIIIACGVNFLVTGIVNYIANKDGLIYIISGCILILLTIFGLMLYDLLRTSKKTIIECAVTYDEENKRLIRIPRYSFSEYLKDYLEAACNESADIKSVWNSDTLGLNGLINKKNNNTQVSLTNSSMLLNKLIEYILLKELSLVTVDYFNNPKFKDSKINKISKNDVPDLFASNEFLSLFSKPMSERVAFNNKEDPSIVLSYAPNGAIYERFELTLPKKSKIHKKGSNIIEIKHPLFKLTLTPAFTGFGEVLPHNFEKFYLKSNIRDVSSYKALIGVELKLSWKALFIRKSAYYEWIDKYIQKLIDYNSFDHFVDRIQWNIVEPIIAYNNKS